MTEVVAALIWQGERFLACQRPPHKARGLLWEFVGGKVEPGETREQALIRECREELGVLVQVGEIFMELTHKYPDLTVHLTLFHAHRGGNAKAAGASGASLAHGGGDGSISLLPGGSGDPGPPAGAIRSESIRHRKSPSRGVFPAEGFAASGAAQTPQHLSNSGLQM